MHGHFDTVRVAAQHDPCSLPTGWVWARLGQLGKWTGGGTPPKANAAYWTGGTVPWVSPKDMKVEVIGDTQDRITPAAVENSSAKYVAPGSVVMVMRSGILRHSFPVAVTDRTVTLNQDLRALTPYEGIEPRFISLYLSLIARRVLRDCSKDGTTVNSINVKALEQVPIALPPQHEQLRIVARVDELFAEVANGETALRAAQDELHIFKRSLLAAAVSGGLTRDWRAVNDLDEDGHKLLDRLRSEHSHRKGSSRAWKPSKPLRPLPEGWAWSGVEEVGEVQLGRQRAPQHHAGEHMRPYLRVANVLEARLDLDDVKSMNFTPDEFATFALCSGDILLNEGQAPDLLGRPALYQGEIEGCCFQKTLLRFRARQGVIPEYALIVFRHYMHSGRFKEESRITTNIGHLTQVRFVVLEFPLPPTAEQQEIARRFRQLEDDATQALDVAGSNTPAALRQSILKAAFEGHLVQRDCSGETATALLTRIKSLGPATSHLGHRRMA